MNKPSQVLTFIFLLILPLSVAGQEFNYEAEYKAAKTELEDGNFQAALISFKKLLDTHPAHKKSTYSSYYFGVAAYSLNDLQKSKDMFLQITRRTPDWNKLPEVFLWLSKISFEMDSPNQGIYYADRIDDSSIAAYAEELKYGYLSKFDIVTLASILSEHETDTVVAGLLATRMVEQKPAERDIDSLASLINHYDLDSSSIGLNYPDDVIKEKYKIAVMLPLFIDRLWYSGIYMQKSLAVELYKGIQLALDEVDTSKVSIEVFDTKRDSLTTARIIEDGRLKSADAIIGPLYHDPIELVSEYSYENQLNFINPVSTNSELIRHNPYAFLLRTGAASMGKIIADYTANKLENKAFAVYRGSRVTDSLAAYNYCSRIKIDSFYVSISQKVETSNARDIFDSLTSAKQVIDTLELERMIKEGEDVRFKPLTDSLYLPVDSLGHIFVSSDNQAIASEVMAAITSRGDTTQIIGVGNWFSHINAGLSLMETMGVWLAMQEFENMLTPVNMAISEKYRSIHNEKPGKYVFYGYYAMKFLSESLQRYGVYYQNGYRKNGNINSMFDYSNSQDNQRLMIFTLKDGIPLIIYNPAIDGENLID